MSDPRDFHLPDLPIIGYSTSREQAATDAIMLFMREVERDRLRLLTIVCEGLVKWRKVARSVWRGAGIDDDAIDAVFHYFELQAAAPTFQVRLLKAQKQPDTWRDVMRDAMPDIERQREQVRLVQKWGPVQYG